MRAVAFIGRGGQGLVFAASTIGEALFNRGYYVAQLQSYGAEVRGGSVLAYVVYGDQAIENPFVEGFTVAAVLHEAGARRWLRYIERTKTTVLDVSLVKTRCGNRIIEAPIAGAAAENGLAGKENMVALGLLVGLSLVDVSITDLEEVLKEKPEYEKNTRALRLGASLASRLK